MSNRRIPLMPNRIYHVYNHANGGDDLFKSAENFRYFLRLYASHLCPIFDTYAYCLLPNHYHLLVHVKELEAVWPALQRSPKGFEKPLGLERQTEISDLLAHRVGSFQNAYAKAFNKQQGRIGSLFMQSFCRKPVEDHSYYVQVMHYIHMNPGYHGLIDDWRNWPYSSYRAFFSTGSSKVDREDALSRCGGKATFETLHQQPVDEQFARIMEDFS